MANFTDRNDDGNENGNSPILFSKEAGYYQNLSNRIFLKFVKSLNSNFLEKTQMMLDKGGMHISAEEYVAVTLLSSLVCVIVFLILSMVGVVFKIPIPALILLVVLIPASGIVSYLSFSKYPHYRAGHREKRINLNLGPAMAFIAALAGADVPVNVIFRELSGRKEYGEVAKEALKITENTELLGMDILTAIYEASKTSPSINWQRFLQGAVTTATAGGRFKPYFISRASEYQNELRAAIKKNTDDISLFAETYVTVGVAFPLFLIVILAVMGVIAYRASSSIVYFLVIFSFLVVPVIIGMFVWLMGSVGKEVSTG